MGAGKQERPQDWKTRFIFIRYGPPFVGKRLSPSIHTPFSSCEGSTVSEKQRSHLSLTLWFPVTHTHTLCARSRYRITCHTPSHAFSFKGEAARERVKERKTTCTTIPHRHPRTYARRSLLILCFLCPHGTEKDEARRQ